MGKNTIYYWSGLIGEQKLINAHSTVLNKIMAGEYKEADLKKLSGHNVYSARVNDTHRLLFTTIRVQGKNCLLFLEEILNHDYQKSRFLKPEVLKQYLDKNKEAYGDVVVKKEDFNSLSSNVDLPQSQTSSPPTYQSASYYNQQFIVLNTEQNAVLAAKMPLLVSGGPGSGKSCVAMSLLRQHAASCFGKKEKILYVTRSERLVTVMREMWDEIRDPENDTEVLFKSYNQLLPELNSIPSKKTLAEQEDFKLWFREYKDRKLLMRTPSKGQDLLMEQLVQEFRIISGYSDSASYLNLGKRQSLFHDKGLRDNVFKAYCSYQVYLDGQKKLDPGFHKPNPEALDHYQMVVVDEAQDFSLSQLKILKYLALDDQICYCLDTHQSLMDNQSKRPFLLQMKDMTQIKLPFSYRCPLNVRTMANAVLTLKATLMGGLSDKDERISMEPADHDEEQKGTVSWMNSIDKETKKNLALKGQSVDFAVVTQPRFLQEARETFKTGLVFTPEEIKGLEYPVVLAFRLFDDELFNKANQKLSRAFQNNSKLKKHRPKADEGDFDFAPPFNQVYTAFTRAMQELIIVQKEEHKNNQLIAQLKNSLPAHQVQANRPVEVKISSTEDWLQEIKKLIRNGNQVQAKLLFDTYFAEGVVEDFETWSKQFLPAPQEQLARLGAADAKLNAVSKTTGLSLSNQRDNSPSGRIASIPLVEIENKPKLSKLEKKINYLQGLKEKFSYNNVKGLLEHKLFLELMFFTPIASENDADAQVPMIEIICLNEQKASIFTKVLSDNPQQALKIGAQILRQVYSEHPSYILFKAQRHSNVSFLFLLSLTVPGRNILNLIEQKNTSLARDLKAEDLCRLVQRDGMPYYGLSPLFFLSSSEEGSLFLHTIFKKNPELAKQIDGGFLCRVIPEETSELNGMTILLNMITYKESRIAFEKLLDLNPGLISQMSGSDLARQVTGAHCKLRISPLGLLIMHDQGLHILKKLLNIQPDLALSITGQDLCGVQNTESGDVHFTPFYFLTTSDKAIEVLERFFEINPKLASQISVEGLTLTPVYKMVLLNKQPQKTSLKNLEEHHLGKTILDKIIHNKPGLLTELSEFVVNMENTGDPNNLPGILQRDFTIACLTGFLASQRKNHPERFQVAAIRPSSTPSPQFFVPPPLATDSTDASSFSITPEFIPGQ